MARGENREVPHSMERERESTSARLRHEGIWRGKGTLTSAFPRRKLSYSYLAYADLIPHTIWAPTKYLIETTETTSQWKGKKPSWQASWVPALPSPCL